MLDKIKDINKLIPEDVVFILSLFKESGFECYLVGGCLRDYLLERTVKDFDFTTNAKPEQVEELFKEHKVINDFKLFGSIKVVVNSSVYDITTYRYNEEYGTKHQPISWSFSNSIHDDLSRRDFTINAFAYNMETFIDKFNGIDDLKSSLIRTVGDSSKRFIEDPIRILRAIRFSSVLDFTIENQTSKNALKYSYLLKTQSKERINYELNEILIGIGVRRVLFEYYPIFYDIAPCLKEVNLLENIGNLRNDMSLEMKLLVLFKGLSLDTFKQELSLLKYPRKLIKNVALLYNYRESNIETVEDLQLSLRNVDYDVLRLLYYGEVLDFIDNLYQEVLKRNLVYRIDQLLIDGNDLATWGIRANARSRVLNELLVLVIKKQVASDRNSLKQYILDVYTKE